MNDADKIQTTYDTVLDIKRTVDGHLTWLFRAAKEIELARRDLTALQVQVSCIRKVIGGPLAED